MVSAHTLITLVNVARRTPHRESVISKAHHRQAHPGHTHEGCSADADSADSAEGNSSNGWKSVVVVVVGAGEEVGVAEGVLMRRPNERMVPVAAVTGEGVMGAKTGRAGVSSAEVCSGDSTEAEEVGDTVEEGAGDTVDDRVEEGKFGRGLNVVANAGRTRPDRPGASLITVVGGA